MTRSQGSQRSQHVHMHRVLAGKNDCIGSKVGVRNGRETMYGQGRHRYRSSGLNQLLP